MLVDKNACHARKSIILEPKVFFSQLQHIFVVGLKASPKLGLQKASNIILAAICTCSKPQKKVRTVYVTILEKATWRSWTWAVSNAL
jgi:hypothetical protein